MRVVLVGLALLAAGLGYAIGQPRADIPRPICAVDCRCGWCPADNGVPHRCLCTGPDSCPR